MQRLPTLQVLEITDRDMSHSSVFSRHCGMTINPIVPQAIDNPCMGGIAPRTWGVAHQRYACRTRTTLPVGRTPSSSRRSTTQPPNTPARPLHLASQPTPSSTRSAPQPCAWRYNATGMGYSAPALRLRGPRRSTDRAWGGRTTKKGDRSRPFFCWITPAISCPCFPFAA